MHMPISKGEALCKQLLDLYLPGLKHRDNDRPDWLMQLEADRAYPEIGLIIEFQGRQHLTPAPHFHKTRDDFLRQLSRDARKHELAAAHGYTIFALAIHDLTPGRFEGWVKRILLHGKDIARQRQDHTLLDQLTMLYARIPCVRVPLHLYAEAERLSHQEVRTRQRRLRWWRRLFASCWRVSVRWSARSNVPTYPAK
jgi:hypothetical protein